MKRESIMRKDDSEEFKEWQSELKSNFEILIQQKYTTDP